MKASSFLRKLCFAGIGAVELSREQLAGARKTVRKSLEKLVKRGERLNEREDSLTRALLAALKVGERVPSTSEVESVIPGYDDMTVTEIIDQIQRLPMKQLELIRDYERHNFDRIRIIRHIERELDEARIIPDYESLPVAKVVERLDDLSPKELAALRDYEKSHRNRTTIIKAIARRLEKAA